MKVQRQLKPIFSRVGKVVGMYLLRDRFLLAHKKWVSDRGDSTLRLNYNLTSESVVFDLGGYKGDFSEKIYAQYQCNIYIFEPVTSFYEGVCERFRGNNKIKVFNFGLSDEDSSIEINLNNDGSSVFISRGEVEIIEVKNITSFIEQNDIHKVDLIKINIEGGEYQVLPALIDSGFINNIGDVQVQFHDFIEEAVVKRSEIRERLKDTHYLTYDYWFVWENWRRKDTR